MLLRNARVRGDVVDLAISDGLIDAVGPGMGAAGPSIDLDGRSVLPGLWDNHVHFDQWALARRRVDLGPAASAAQAVDLLAAHLACGERVDELIVGAGFRDGLWPDRPTRALLDAVAPAVPVVLVSADLHCCWINTAAAHRYGLAAREDALIRETDWYPIMEDVRRVPAGTLDARVDDACRAAAARGVVGVVDFEAPFPLDAWAARIAGGADRLRVVAPVWPSRLDEAVDRGLRTGDPVAGSGGLLTMGPLKIVSDGSLNTRTAYCYDPYPDSAGRPNPCGMELVAEPELRRLLARAAAHGLDVAVHAIGDRAATLVLDAFAATGARGRVEHAQLLADDDLARFAALGVVASVQPEHLCDDRDVADRYWPGRTHRAFPYGALLAAGAELVLGSDAPVAPLDPWPGVAAAVHRSRDGRPRWHPEQEIPLDVALAAAAGPDGPLRAGRRADLVVTDADPHELDPAGLRAMPVAATMVGGRWTYSAGLGTQKIE